MRTHRILVALALSGALATGVAACGGDDNNDAGSSGASASGNAAATAAADAGSAGVTGGSINGAGATFPAPIYQEWAARYKDEAKTTVNYQGIGSGGGIAQFTAGTVDFGASDSAMKDEEVTAAEKKGEPVHVPTVFGAVTVSYNVPGVETGLKLDGKTVADIFLGKVTTWNDPQIAANAGGVKLPDTKITVCHRNDESGTTALFTSFLADYSPAWKNGPGTDKSVKWPTGTGAKGNDGVAACVKQTSGAVGYVEQAYALANDFTFAAVKNAAGDFITPTLDSTSAAGDDLDVPADLRYSAINAPGKTAYPIASSTFILVYQDMCKAGMAEGQAQRVQGFLDYALGAGQDVAKELEYAPLPAAIHAKAQAKVDGLQCDGAPLKAS
jgi:phosphate transport system substrate-binding protein